MLKNEIIFSHKTFSSSLCFIYNQKIFFYSIVSCECPSYTYNIYQNAFRFFSSWLYLLNFLPVSFDFHFFLSFFFSRGYERALLLTFEECVLENWLKRSWQLLLLPFNLCRNEHVGVRQVSTGMQCVCLCMRVCVHIFGCECVCVLAVQSALMVL